MTTQTSIQQTQIKHKKRPFNPNNKWTIIQIHTNEITGKQTKHLEFHSDYRNGILKGWRIIPLSFTCE